MLRLLHEKLDALADPLDPGFGFDLIRLEALLAEETKPATISFDADENARRQIAFLIDRLSARFGEHRVQRFVPQDTHIPEAAGVAVPAQDRDFDTRSLDRANATPSDPPRRPLRLFEKPEEIDVVADGAGWPARALSLAACAPSKWRAPKARNASPWNGGESTRPDARLFPRRNEGRPALLALSRRPLSATQIGGSRAGIMHGVFRMTAPMPNSPSPPIFPSCAAPRIPANSSTRPRIWAMPPSASPTATRWPAWCAPMRPGESWTSDTRPRLLVGARLVFRDGTPDILAYPRIAPPMAGSAGFCSLGNRARPRANAFWIWPILLTNIAMACC